MQGADEGSERAHLPQTTKVDVPEVRQNQNAEAQIGTRPVRLFRLCKPGVVQRNVGFGVRDLQRVERVPGVELDFKR
jgi:hypothetical protein